MGIIQSAVNQALGTVGTVAGIGRVAKTSQESLDLQQEAAKEAKSERAKQLANIEFAESEAQKVAPIGAGTNTGYNLPINKKQVYFKEQLANMYEKMGDFNKAFDLREGAIKGQQFLLKREKSIEEANAQEQLKNLQKQQSEDFQKKFMEGVNVMRTRKEEVK